MASVSKDLDQKTIVAEVVATSLSMEWEQKLHHSLLGIAKRNPGQHIKLDMSRVTFVTASGLNAILEFRRRLLSNHGKLSLKVSDPFVREVFEITHLDTIIPIV